MSDPSDPPRLGFWLDPGRVPGEVKRWIERRGGVDPAADKVLQDLRTVKGSKVVAIKWRAYALLAYCVQESQPPPPKLMRLLFECLRVPESQPPLELCNRYHWMHVKQPDKVNSVLDADARAMS